MNRIVDSGVELSFLVPLNGAFSPLVMIFVGVFLYKEEGVSLENRCLADGMRADWFCKLLINW